MQPGLVGFIVGLQLVAGNPGSSYKGTRVYGSTWAPRLSFRNRTGHRVDDSYRTRSGLGSLPNASLNSLNWRGGCDPHPP